MMWFEKNLLKGGGNAILMMLRKVNLDFKEQVLSSEIQMVILLLMAGKNYRMKLIMLQKQSGLTSNLGCKEAWCQETTCQRRLTNHCKCNYQR